MRANRRQTLSVLAGILVSLVPAALPAQAALAITGATVIDGTGRPPQSHVTLVVRDGRIAALGPDGSVPIPPGARRIDGAGRYVIAGLWDMHVHLSATGPEALSSFVRYGITSVRDMGGRTDSLLAWRDAVAAGAVVDPRPMLSGPIVENAGWLRRVAGLDVPGLADLADERIGVETVADAERAVDSITRLGVPVVKIRTSPKPEAYAALGAAARRRGLLLAGHQPGAAIGLEGALVAGQRSIEHIEALGQLESMTPPARDSLAGRLAAAPLWFTPTLITSFGRFRPESLVAARVAGRAPDDSLQPLVTPRLRAFWRQQLDMKRFDASLEEYRRMVEGGLAGLRRLWRGGVKILAGTDLGAPLIYPGPSLHDELVLLVDSLGMSPLQAIQAATIEPARFVGMADSLGTVEAGKLADLVLLTADPLADVRNTRRVAGVVLRGAWQPAR